MVDGFMLCSFRKCSVVFRTKNLRNRERHGASPRLDDLNFTFEIFHHLRNSSVFVQGGKWKAYTQADKLYLFTRTIGLIDGPSMRRAAVYFDGLVFGSGEHIFLNSRTGAIQAEFPPPIVGFGGI